MGALVTVREVFRRASALLQDIDPQFGRHAETDMVDAFNDAQRALFTYLPPSCTSTPTIRLKPGTVQRIDLIDAADYVPDEGGVPTLPLACTMLQDVLMNMGAAGNTPGRAIRPLLDGRETLDTLSPNWHAETGTEVEGFIYDPRTPVMFLAYPGVPAGRLWVRAAVVVEPKPIPNVGEAGYASYAASGTNALKMTVQDTYVSAVVHYICARLLMKNAQFARATGMTPDAYAQLFIGELNSRAQALLGHSPNLKSLPFSPEPMGAAS